MNGALFIYIRLAELLSISIQIFSLVVGLIKTSGQRQQLIDRIQPYIFLTRSPPNKFSSAIFLVCFNLQTASMSRKVCEIVV